MSDTLGDRLKEFEAQKDYELSPDSYWVMRLDGHGFSKFTKRIGAKKPYDKEFADAMRATTRALMDKFGFVTAYCQSDEITLIPQVLEGRNNLWNLRIQKLCSLVASYASVVFSREISSRLESCDATHLIPTFDARVFVVEELDDLKKSILWRQYDCLKNAKNLVAQSLFSHKELQGLHSDEMIAKVRDTHGIEFELFPAEFRYGSLYKRCLREGSGFNPLTQEKVSVLRGVLTEYNCFIPSTEFVISKYWE